MLKSSFIPLGFKLPESTLYIKEVNVTPSGSHIDFTNKWQIHQWMFGLQRNVRLLSPPSMDLLSFNERFVSTLHTFEYGQLITYITFLLYRRLSYLQSHLWLDEWTILFRPTNLKIQQYIKYIRHQNYILFFEPAYIWQIGDSTISFKHYTDCCYLLLKLILQTG